MTRQQFMKSLKKFPGVTFDYESERCGGNLQIDSPKGKQFSDGCHTIVEPFTNNSGQSWKSEAYQSVIDRLNLGLVDCDIENCDICES